MGEREGGRGKLVQGCKRMVVFRLRGNSHSL